MQSDWRVNVDDEECDMIREGRVRGSYLGSFCIL